MAANTQTDSLIRAVQLATRKLATSGRLDLLLKEVLKICVEAVGASGGTIYVHEPDLRRLRFQQVLPESVRPLLPRTDIEDDYGIAGEAFQKRQTVLKEFPPKADNERNEFEVATNVTIRSIVAIPLQLTDEVPVGVVQLLNKESGPFNETDVAVLDIIAAVSAMAFLNFKLIEESSRASTLLGMGKVSHDIGNLAASLHATISFSEFTLDDVEEKIHASGNDTLIEAVAPLHPLHQDLRNSVDRIVGYSRLISDMSAGKKLTPKLKNLSLSHTIKSAASYLESDARAKQVKLLYNFPDDPTAFPHDDLFVFRIVQNLVGNAIKAVQETTSEEWLDKHSQSEDEYCGTVIVDYKSDGSQRIFSVKDSGPGMSEETIEKILHGSARSQWDKASGSGWGMKIVLELASASKANVKIKSELGNGSEFIVVFDSQLP